jgi:hypothetical protein
VVLFLVASSFGGGCDLAPFAPPPPVNGTIPEAPTDVVAEAGPDLVVLEGQRVVLSGTGSRALFGEATLAWTQREGPPTALSNPSAPSPFFTAPLAPARLVFTLSASIDGQRDEDEVVVDVVGAGPLPAPRLQSAPADVIAVADALVSLVVPWRGAGDPDVRPRCALRGPTSVRRDDDVVIDLLPAALPCAVVVDDVGAPGTRGGRIAVVVWPAGTRLPDPTRVVAPAVVDPGADVVVATGPATTVQAADGSALDLVVDDAATRFVAPTVPGPVGLVAERRAAVEVPGAVSPLAPDGTAAAVDVVGNASGGQIPLQVVVRPGTDNRAPTVDAFDELRVPPGGRFRIAPRGRDDDGDALVFERRQVLGANAARVDALDDVLTAPDSADVLVFHVQAFDGVARSPPVVARVVVDPAATNRPPELTVAPVQFVTPGETFTLDASGARDADSGIVVSYQIAQAADDARILLPVPVDVATVELTAVDDGDVMHFLLSAYDDGGAGVTVPVTVIVERAGPWVDPARGDDARGDGTDARPFATVSAAIDVASRHRFPALRLAGGVHAAFDGALPDGLGLVGGGRFDGSAYVDGGPGATLPLGAGGLAVAGADIRLLRLQGGDLRVARAVVLDEVSIDGDLEIEAGSRVVGRVLAVDGAVSAASAEVRFVDAVVGRGIVATDTELELVGVTVETEDAGAAEDGSAPALAASGGTVVVETSRFAVTTTGLRLVRTTARLAAVVELAGGDDAPPRDRVGVVVDGGAVEFAPLEITVAGLGEDSVTGLRLAGARATGSLRVDVATSALARGIVGTAVDLHDSHIQAAGDDVIGVDVDDVQLVRGVVRATGRVVRAVRATTGVVVASRVLAALAPPPGAGQVGADVIAADVARLALQHTTLRASGTAIRAVDGLRTVQNCLVVAPRPFDLVAGFAEGREPVPLAGVVGVVEVESAEALDPTLCPRCVVGPARALSDDDRLVEDAVLGVVNPFVDVGDAEDATPADFFGTPVPRGAAPDLGCHER